jgi:tetratricopeptide (TPR) repeat protein
MNAERFARSTPNMDAAAWKRVQALFSEAVELPAAERAAWLDVHCPDAELRARLEQLLAADAGTSSCLSPQPSLEALLETPTSSLVAGARIGPYRLMELIATGGMGTVWRAEQSQPRRMVALKTLRADIPGIESLKRFRAEAELLGHLRHPGIAQVFDAGTVTVDGREVPYLAMEYIEGSRGLLDSAREQALDRTERLRLFADVCDAVHHGHQRGVIHRDLKPGNILVDLEGRPKVIDFGLARALDPAVLGVSLAHTRAGEIFGTLPYMSPEQIAGNLFDVDVRSDVYALGCILCEMVTGRPPIDVEGLALPEVGRRIAEEPPRIPGTLPADLRWILTKTLEKDPARRYPSASELAADVRRLLASEPVLAGPPSSMHQLARFARRHRFGLTSALAVFVALLVGLVQALREARAATAARVDALARGVEADAARRLAERQASLALTAGFFLSEIFNKSDVFAQGRDARVVDAIADAEGKLATIADPTARAILSSIVGKAHLYLGERARAAPLLEEAVRTLRAELPEEDLFRLDAEVVYADFLEQEQRFAESIALSEELLPRLEVRLGAGHKQTNYVRFNLALCRKRSGDPREAERLFRISLDCIDSAEVETGPPLERVDLVRSIGNVLIDQERFEEGIEELGRALDLERALSVRSPRYEATIRMDLGAAWTHAGDHDLALAELEQAERLYAAHGTDLLNQSSLSVNQATCLLKLQRLDDAQRKLDQARQLVGIGWSSPGMRHVVIGLVQAQIDLARSDWTKTEASARAVLTLAEQVMPRESPYAGLAHLILSQALFGAQRFEEARNEAQLAWESLAATSAKASCANALHVWVDALLELGDGVQAAARATELLALTPSDSPRRAEREEQLRRAQEISATAASRSQE